MLCYGDNELVCMQWDDQITDWSDDGMITVSDIFVCLVKRGKWVTLLLSSERNLKLIEAFKKIRDLCLLALF